MSVKTDSCESRIQDSQDNCEEYLTLMFKIVDNERLDEDDEDDVKVLQLIEDECLDEDSIYEYALGTSVQKVMRIELSTGGPASFIEAYLDDENNVDEVFYHFQDWFDGAKRKVSSHSAIYRYAQFMAEGL
ncbi:hypothetical protein UFOVP573_37 [uncultured Caudovirales phage]|uniref:Uncharacterized protein n=1 Tax=uncultured Caudovirales phage TaxID=2100421 RepID=A0A6J7XLZ7_9CAUD|nr:hypothetical protein UFOVP288_78 [uncultured Caudovirales phage]CAB4146156.1 hypothetical protein UFOVP483_118 [uncultured Caudovirales phage]CAB4150784.1 hypothetical protein UFOVP573_37 [uncultured Caudovirales phage]CAB4161564.1 hypothetical protein UFOVP769_78 [uncultured Caudovirales phage]CAB4174400.1 hypothetical protein UFOVP962_46 [uncultured Caudovirales phage]